MNKATREKGVMKKVVFVLAGGGAMGAHHIGAIRYLEEVGIYPDLLIGSSVGVLNACLYATGGVEQMERCWLELSFPSLRDLSPTQNPFRGCSLFTLKRILPKVEKFIDFEKVFHSHIEVACIVVNFSKGHEEIHSNRSVKNLKDFRTIISMSFVVPGVFPPVRYKGDYYVDGGFACNMHLDYSVDIGGTDIYILALYSRKLNEQKEFNNVFQVLLRMNDFLWRTYGNYPLWNKEIERRGTFRNRQVHIIEPLKPLKSYNPVTLSLMRFNPHDVPNYIHQGYLDAKRTIESERTKSNVRRKTTDSM